MFTIDVAFASRRLYRDATAARFAHPLPQTLMRPGGRGADLLSALRPDERWRTARLPYRHRREWTYWFQGTRSRWRWSARCWSGLPASMPGRRSPRLPLLQPDPSRHPDSTGPIAFSRHPAYLSKNLFWWISTIPFLTTGSVVDAARGRAADVCGQRGLLLAGEDRGTASRPRSGLSRLFVLDGAQRHGAEVRFIGWMLGKKKAASFCEV